MTSASLTGGRERHVDRHGNGMDGCRGVIAQEFFLQFSCSATAFHRDTSVAGASSLEHAMKVRLHEGQRTFPIS
jgi:hypothetical protein